MAGTSIPLNVSSSKQEGRFFKNSLEEDTGSESRSDLVKAICGWHQEMAPGLSHCAHFMELVFDIAHYKEGLGFLSSFLVWWMTLPLGQHLMPLNLI